MKRIPYLFFIAFLLLTGCRDRYDLPLRDNDISLLVVEGALVVGGPTGITLSRNAKLTDAVKFKPELNAQVSVEDRTGGRFPLQQMGNGLYVHAQLPMVAGQEYRLHIRTTNNKEYLSDYVTAKQTPEIDSVSWKFEREGVEIYANTHDATNNSLYYKWDYDETWEIRSYFPASYRWTGGTTIVYAGLHNYICWKYDRSKTILLGSTAQLQSDVVSEAPLTFIPPGAERLGVRYSILVRQQALTKPAYEYLSQMKKNTESLGTIFDPQPSELRGNIRCVSNPEEDVIGYLTASSISEKRLFITAAEAKWRYVQSCESFKIKNLPDSIALWVPGYLPHSAEEMFGVVTDYYMSAAGCVDCTARGGNLNKPSYW